MTRLRYMSWCMFAMRLMMLQELVQPRDHVTNNYESSFIHRQVYQCIDCSIQTLIQMYICFIVYILLLILYNYIYIWRQDWRYHIDTPQISIISLQFALDGRYNIGRCRWVRGGLFYKGRGSKGKYWHAYIYVCLRNKCICICVYSADEQG